MNVRSQPVFSTLKPSPVSGASYSYQPGMALAVATSPARVSTFGTPTSPVHVGLPISKVWGGSPPIAVLGGGAPTGGTPIAQPVGGGGFWKSFTTGLFK